MSGEEREAAVIARHFHDTYEYLAPAYGYETRRASAVEWDAVPAANRALMTHTVANLIAEGLIVPGPRFTAARSSVGLLEEGK